MDPVYHYQYCSFIFHFLKIIALLFISNWQNSITWSEIGTKTNLVIELLSYPYWFWERLVMCFAAAVLSCFVPICQYPPSKGSISYLVSYHFVILSHNKCLQSGNFAINVLYNSLKLACWRCHLVSLHSLSSLQKEEDVIHNLLLYNNCDSTILFKESVRMCYSRNYPYPSHGGCFGLNPKFLEIQVWVHTLLKNLGFWKPLPLRISKSPPWSVYA